MGSLKLTETETETLAGSLDKLLIKKLSDLLENKLDEVKIMNLLTKLSDVKIEEALKDLLNALNDSID